MAVELDEPEWQLRIEEGAELPFVHRRYLGLNDRH